MPGGDLLPPGPGAAGRSPGCWPSWSGSPPTRRPWTPAERQACWAAGLWVRAFNAKKERLSGGGPQLERLAAEVGERAARAGLEA